MEICIWTLLSNLRSSGRGRRIPKSCLSKEPCGVCGRIFTRCLCRRRPRLCAVYVLSTTLSPEAHGTVHSSGAGGKSVIWTHTLRVRKDYTQHTQCYQQATPERSATAFPMIQASTLPDNVASWATPTNELRDVTKRFLRGCV